MTDCQILSYQGYGCPESFVEPLEGVSGVTGITNAEGVISYALADYAEIQPSGTDFTVRVNAGIGPVFPIPDPLDYEMTVTVGLIGCMAVPGANCWVDDLLACNLTADASINQTTFATLTPQNMERYDTGGTGAEEVECHQLNGGGITNFIFSGIPYSQIANPDGQDWDFRFPNWGNAGSLLRIGSFFIGFDVPLRITPNSFSWTTEVLNERFLSRGGTAISSDGVIRRGASFEATDIPIGDVTGKDELFGGTSPATYRANLFRAAVANIGQQMLLNPYPHVIDGHLDEASDDAQAAALSNMQNFFSIYGLLERRNEYRQQYGPGLKTRFSCRFNFMEYR